MQRRDRKISLILLFVTMTIPFLFCNVNSIWLVSVLSFVVIILDLYYIYLYIKSLKQKRFLKKVFEGKNICKLYENKPLYCKKADVLYYRLHHLKLLPLFDFDKNHAFYLQSDDIRYLYQIGHINVARSEKTYTVELVIS